MVEANDVLFLASLFAIVKTKSSLFMVNQFHLIFILIFLVKFQSESPPSRNDPLKVFRLIQRHKISQLLMAQCQMKLLSRAMDSSDIWSGEEGGQLGVDGWHNIRIPRQNRPVQAALAALHFQPGQSAAPAGEGAD
jgi:hypothetical protein